MTFFNIIENVWYQSVFFNTGGRQLGSSRPACRRSSRISAWGVSVDTLVTGSCFSIHLFSPARRLSCVRVKPFKSYKTFRSFTAGGSPTSLHRCVLISDLISQTHLLSYLPGRSYLEQFSGLCSSSFTAVTSSWSFQARGCLLHLLRT